MNLLAIHFPHTENQNISKTKKLKKKEVKSISRGLKNLACTTVDTVSSNNRNFSI